MSEQENWPLAQLVVESKNVSALAFTFGPVHAVRSDWREHFWAGRIWKPPSLAELMFSPPSPLEERAWEEEHFY